LKKNLIFYVLAFTVSTFAFAGSSPPLPAGTRPLYIEDPVLPSDPKEPVGFACYEGCGRSCDCVDKKESSTTTCHEGQKCTWKIVRCRTHSFCRWHDGCYRSCDFNFPGVVDDGSLKRATCYRACDFACVDGKEPEITGGWKTQPPGSPPEALGVWECLKRLAWSPDVTYDPTPLLYAGTPSCTPDETCK